MSSKMKTIRRGQESYYDSLLEKHGISVDAVASGKQIYKDLRYAKLCQLFHHDAEFSLHDVGFGLGHLYEYMKQQWPEKKIDYSGSEVTPKFVDYCLERYPDSSFQLRDLAESVPSEQYDYLVFGGTFYHLIDSNPEDFWSYVKQMLTNAFACAKKGIAFNLITSYVDYQLDGLFYADIHSVTDFVAKDLSRYFQIHHNYPLYEYTVLVYKEDAIAQQFPQEEFLKYYKNTTSPIVTSN